METLSRCTYEYMIPTVPQPRYGRSPLLNRHMNNALLYTRCAKLSHTFWAANPTSTYHSTACQHTYADAAARQGQRAVLCRSFPAWLVAGALAQETVDRSVCWPPSSIARADRCCSPAKRVRGRFTRSIARTYESIERIETKKKPAGAHHPAIVYLCAHTAKLVLVWSACLFHSLSLGRRPLN
jgi:hypothetical protein